jgi:hypothetical protein
MGKRQVPAKAEVPPPEKQRRLWTDEDVQRGLEFLKSNPKHSVRAAAEHCDVPRSTFQLYANGKLKIGARSGPPTALSAIAEKVRRAWDPIPNGKQPTSFIQLPNHFQPPQVLLSYIGDVSKRRLTPTIADVRRAAAELETVEAKAAKREPRWPEGSASKDWWLGFKGRHALRLRSCQVDSADRIAACTP